MLDFLKPTRGDVDGFFGLFLDNLIQLLVIMGILGIVGIDAAFILQVILPGAAVSLLAGNIFYAWQADQLVKREGRSNVTALPYGINTVSLFAFVFFVMKPVYEQTGSATKAWQAGIAATFYSGLIEFFGSFAADHIRKFTPRAALLSTLAGIAVTFISMDFLFRTFASPLIAFLPLVILMLQYFGRIRMPGNLPGGAVSVAIGTLLAWSSGLWGKEVMVWKSVTDTLPNFGFHLPVPVLGQLIKAIHPDRFTEFASVIIPMGIFNVIGSLQNIESAAAAGDNFDTRSSLAVNGIGTILGSVFGSPFPTTIYIGHPGWKALGAKASYSSMNGIAITILALTGLTSTIAAFVPIEAGMAIVLWIGIIIATQAFRATNPDHAPAVVVGMLPALAAWAVLVLQNAFFLTAGNGIPNLQTANLHPPFFPYIGSGMLALSQGFLLTSLIWSSITVFIIDHKFRSAGVTAAIAAFLCLLGFLHDYGLTGNAIVNTYRIPVINEFLFAYSGLAAVFFLIAMVKK